MIYVDKEKAPFIKKAFELYASGNHTLKNLRKIINGLGLRGHKEKELSNSNYQYILKNPFYYGLIRYNKEYFEGKHEPIITKKLFDEVQEIMKRKSKPQKADKMKYFLYRGFFHCGECGYTITADKKVKKSGKEYIYYYCTKRSPHYECRQKGFTKEENISSQVGRVIQKVSLPEIMADWMINEIKQEKKQKVQSINFFAQKIKDEIIKLDEKLEKLMNAYLESALNLAEYREAKNKLINEKQALKDKLSAFEQKSNNRFELMINFIKQSKQAKIIALQKNLSAKRDFLKKIGSNFRLSERPAARSFNEVRSVVFDYKNAWKILALNEFRPANAGRKGEIIFKKSEIVKMRCLLDEIRTYFEQNPD